MKYIIFLLLLSVLENKCEVVAFASYHGLQGPREAQVEWFPYEAVIGPLFCAGILISEQYVITPEYCVKDYSGVTVYLGFRGTPEIESNRNEKRTQIFKSCQVIVHENYDSIRYTNNIALVKLSETAILNEKVSPAKLLSNKMYPIEDTFANVSGWFNINNNSRNMHFETVKILSQDTCNSYIESDEIESQDLCVEIAAFGSFLDRLGNAVEVNNKIVGFVTFKLVCLIIDNSNCERVISFRNLIPFLGWISEKTNIPIEKLTGETEEDSSKVLRKIDDLSELIQKLQITLEQEKTNCNEKIKSLLEKFEMTKEKMENIQETVYSILQENNVTKSNSDKHPE